MTKDSKNIKIFISCGEPSSDQLAASFVKEIKKLHPNSIIKAIGGEELKKEGIKSLFPVKDIAVMGYFEVITSIPRIYKRLKQATKAVIDFAPDVVITVDAHGFNFRLVGKIKPYLKHTKYINYVSPSIWAYRYNRIHSVKKLFDHQFTLYPFEKKYYDREGVPCTFIGHPLTAETYLTNQSLDYSATKTICISLLPGSRVGEIKKMLPIFIQAILLLKEKISHNISLFIPTKEHLKPLLTKKLHDTLENKIHYFISSNTQDKKIYYKLSHLALSKSGTVSLELMFYRLPIIVAHKISSITAFFVRRFLKIKYASIGNIMANKPVLPELLQENCNPQMIADHIQQIIAKKIHSTNYSSILQDLQNHQKINPSTLAAQTLLEIIGNKD